MIGYSIRVSIDTEELKRNLDKFSKKLDDLSPFWQSFVPVVQNLFNEVFINEGAVPGSGRWQPLSPKYQEWKSRNYPGKTILRLTDRLYNETVNSPVVIIGPNEMTYGTNVPYAQYLEEGTSKMPPRPLFGAVANYAPAILQAEILDYLRSDQ